jgi:defect in organelle trafficking protein DotA
MKKLFKFSLLLVLLLVVQAVFAADFTLPKLPTLFTPPDTDMSLKFLRSIFGTVGGGLVGTGPTIFGEIFKIFNAGILSVMGAILSYSVFKFVISTASDGEPMAKKLTHWHAIRAAVGVGILVPKATGYSILNGIVMWAVVQGIGFADTVWNTSLDYFDRGGVLYSGGKSLLTGGAVVDTALIGAIADTQGGSADITRSFTCMYTLQNVIQKYVDNKKQELKDYPEKAPPSGTPEYAELMTLLNTAVTFHPGYSKDNWRVTFPGNISEDKYKQFEGVCGKYDVSWSGASKAETDTYIAAKSGAMQHIVSVLDNQGKTLANKDSKECDKDQTSTYCTEALRDDTARLLLSSAAEYQSMVNDARMRCTNSECKLITPNEKIESIISDAKKNGWVTAGQYYFVLATLSNVPVLEGTHYQMTVLSPPPAIIGGEKPNVAYENLAGQSDTNISFRHYLPTEYETYSNDLKNKLIWIKNSVDRAIQFDNELSAQTTTSLLGATFQGFQTTSTAPGTTMAGPKHIIAGDWLIMDPFYKHLEIIISSWNTIFSTPEQSSLIKLQAFGIKIVNEISLMWDEVASNLGTMLYTFFGVQTALTIVAAGLATGTIFGATVGWQNFTFAAQQIATTAIKIFVEIPVMVSLPVVLAAIGPLFTMGLLLAFYIPMIPFMLFTFGVISWIIFVIEAMTASPLVALGMTHPEGHDLLGRAEQAIMLLLSVFLRPLTMIIGLFAALVLSFVAMDVLNAGFGTVVDKVFGSSLSFGTGAAAVTISYTGGAYKYVSGCVLIVIYTLIAIALTNQCFGLIYVIPEKIMRWIGMHPEAPEAPHLLESVKAGVTPYGEVGGRAMGEGMGRVAGGIGMSWGAGSLKGDTQKKEEKTDAKPKK